jgi:hypothetical protein
MGHQQAYLAADAGKQRGSRANQTFISLANNRRLLMAAAFLFSLFGACLAGSSGHAQSGPFAGMAGNWAGGGTITLDDGSKERIRCRATYSVAGINMTMTLTCASDSYRFVLQANVAAQAGAVTGTWNESSRNINGTIQGRGGGGNFEVIASSGGFNASISLRTAGNRQSIGMRADSQFRGAAISLSR